MAVIRCGQIQLILQVYDGYGMASISQCSPSGQLSSRDTPYLKPIAINMQISITDGRTLHLLLDLYQHLTVSNRDKFCSNNGYWIIKNCKTKVHRLLHYFMYVTKIDTFHNETLTEVYA